MVMCITSAKRSIIEKISIATHMRDRYWNSTPVSAGPRRTDELEETRSDAVRDVDACQTNRNRPRVTSTSPLLKDWRRIRSIDFHI